jgi:polar amino acid transport system permease protein
MKNNMKEEFSIRTIIRIVIALLVLYFALSLASDFVTNDNYHWDVVAKYLFSPRILEGMGWTVILTAASMVVGSVLAVTLALMGRSAFKTYRWLSKFYIWFFRGTPVYTQLVFWGLIAVLFPRIILGIPFTSVEFISFTTRDIFTALVAAILGLGLNEAAYLAEIVRAGIDSVPDGQAEAARALGLSNSAVMRRIVLPQAMKVIIPPTGNESIGMLKTTSLALAVPFTYELTYVQGNIANRTYFPVPLLLVACFWYLVITTVLMVGQHFLEKKFGKTSSLIEH